jgi:hypothetical protein
VERSRQLVLRLRPGWVGQMKRSRAPPLVMTRGADRMSPLALVQLQGPVCLTTCSGCVASTRFNPFAVTGATHAPYNPPLDAPHVSSSGRGACASRLRGEDQRHNQTVQAQCLRKDHDQNHPNEQLGLLSQRPRANVSHDPDGKASRKAAETTRQSRREVCCATEKRILRPPRPIHHNGRHHCAPGKEHFVSAMRWVHQRKRFRGCPRAALVRDPPPGHHTGLPGKLKKMEAHP